MKNWIPLGLWLLAAAWLPAQEPRFKATENVVYHHKFGMALVMDILEPEQKNGLGVILVVSGGWRSDKEALKNTLLYRVMLERGYTVFAVMHGAQPKFQIPEIIEDIERGVRFVRHHSKRYGVDPEKLGIYGFSAGGHLSLMMGTKGGPGAPDAPNPVDRQSSAVQVVACFYPPTDFLNYGKPGEDAVGVGTLKNYQAAFGPAARNEETRAQLGQAISPIRHLTARSAPTLIIHGDEDLLVPIYQAEIFVKKCEELGVPAKLIRKPGKKHGWPAPEFEQDVRRLADWFDLHLRGLQPKEAF